MEKILAYLKKNGITRMALADASGLSRSLITHILQGRKRITPATAIKLQRGTLRALRAKDICPELKDVK